MVVIKNLSWLGFVGIVKQNIRDEQLYEALY